MDKSEGDVQVISDFILRKSKKATLLQIFLQRTVFIIHIKPKNQESKNDF